MSVANLECTIQVPFKTIYKASIEVAIPPICILLARGHVLNPRDLLAEPPSAKSPFCRMSMV